MPKYAPYKFGAASAALLGVALKSNGQLTVFARQRPPAVNDGGPAPAMRDLYRSAPLALTGKGSVDFTLTLRDQNVGGTPKEGLVVMSPMIWPRFYPGSLFVSLGAHDPLGAVDIDYASFGPVHRPVNIPSSREVSFSFQYDPAAADPGQRAVLVFHDHQSGGLLTQRYAFAGLDHLPAAHAGVVVTLQVDPAHYDNGCASLEFTSAQKFDVTRDDNGTMIQGLSRFVLNTSADPR